MVSRNEDIMIQEQDSVFTDKIQAKEAPCQHACPARIDVPRYIQLIGQEMFDEALKVICEKIPFPSVCGRVCTAPCEAKCRLREWGGAIPIRALKRFVAEEGARASVQKATPVSPTGKRVAIVGSGPAGLTAAYILTKRGHSVTLFERLPQPGGILNGGIPSFILPPDIVRKEIENILRTGVELRLNELITNVNELPEAGYHAVFVATGAGEGNKLPIPGADLEGVHVGLSFLRSVHEGKQTKLGKKVLVIGGGSVACDVARVARRLRTCEVGIACLESRESMPAFPREIEETEMEGVIIYPSRSVTKIMESDGHVAGVECLKVGWMKFDKAGGLVINPISGSRHILEADTVIFATGQVNTLNPVPNNRIEGINKIFAKPNTLETNHPGVFAGGDVVSGPSSIIEAIAAGRRAASSIDRYLGGTAEIDEKLSSAEVEVKVSSPSIGVPPGIGERAEIPSRSIEQRLQGFDVELPLTRSLAIPQAERCLRCDLPIVVDMRKCNGCLICQLRCSLRLEKAFNPSKSAIKVQSTVGHKDGAAFAVTFCDDSCDTCGLCVKYCPTGALTRQKKEI